MPDRRAWNCCEGVRARRRAAHGGIDAEQPLVQPAHRPAPHQPVRQRRQPAPQSTTRGRHGRTAGCASGRPCFLIVLMQKLGLEAGHVHVGRTFTLARLALQAEIERLVQGGIGQCRAGRPGRSGPAAARWPGRACCAARRASPGTTGTSCRRAFLRHSPTPAHSSAAATSAAVGREVERRRHVRRTISRAVAQVGRQRRGIDDLAGIEEVRADRSVRLSSRKAW